MTITLLLNPIKTVTGLLLAVVPISTYGFYSTHLEWKQPLQQIA